MALRREPTPVGAVAELFDRLHELHLDAGEPGVRQIASGIGRGVLSHTSVHNTFRGPKVPKWGHLELIVDQLGGDTEAFRRLWRLARLAELASSGEGEADAAPPPDSDAAEMAAPPGPSARGADRRFDFVLVTSRIPFSNHTKGFLSAAGAGLDQILQRLVSERKGGWVGWARRDCDLDRVEPSPDLSLLPVMLSEREIELHLEGHCNSTLWPLYHDAIERPEFHRAWRETYRLINKRYAETVVHAAAPGATVWVHDYQLQLVPEMLRERRPDLRIGFFLHTPMPPFELFTKLPDRGEVLRGLLGADLVGFQGRRSLGNFLLLCRELLHLRTSADGVEVGGRTVMTGVYPSSIDVVAVEELVGQPRTERRARQIRAELGDPGVLVAGIDRLDYTKGIEQRMVAYGEILEDLRSVASPPAFIQVATLSRERVARYASLRERVDRLAGRLNGSYGRMGSPAVRYTNNALDFSEVVALYRAADIMVATPLSDGMNLVAKEYVSSRVDDEGVLILSEFAGAAAEFGEAILVNPNDTGKLKDAILRAIAMSPGEQGERMKAMRDRLRARDGHVWAASFVAALQAASSRLADKGGP
ncbi:trehalose-6-phosphate synthase [Amycolatopsis oliviviridis]|uniref:Trehalose-6-phosphate synthase n=1 Tax=Amycolatopsis oliviviridis TaxID=1471590 RepID=A0ABQ3L6F9_9PSEU|nr:trehalose-6-phosphate synthase [Amycolatopsis oliviviridis]